MGVKVRVGLYFHKPPKGLLPVPWLPTSGVDIFVVLLRITVQLSCIGRGHDCHFCVYNLGPWNSLLLCSVNSKRSALQNRPFIWFTRRPVKSCSGKANMWSHSASQDRIHGGEIKLDTWRRTKGSPRRQQHGEAAQHSGHWMEVWGWRSENPAVTWGGPKSSKALRKLKSWRSCLLCLACEPSVPCLLSQRQAPRHVMGEGDNRPGCGLAWIMILSNESDWNPTQISRSKQGEVLGGSTEERPKPEPSGFLCLCMAPILR